jgi:hypothetical protein
MALVRNGANVLASLARFSVQGGSYGLRSVLENGGKRFAFAAGAHTVSGVTNRAAKPQGALHPIAWQLPVKAGGLSSHNEAKGAATGTLSLASGRNIAGTADGSSTASATLQLVVSLAGTAAGSASVSGNVVASLSGSGTTAGSCTASATIGALAWAYGPAAGSCTASATLTATGRLYGSISSFTELSPETLAAKVLEYAEASPIHADVRKVNAYTVGGDGQSGTEWGPA